MTIAETDRLYLRHMSTDDAAFILELLNEPAWLEFIGDRGVRDLDDARAYIANGPVAMVERYGFGLFVAIRKADLAPIGICGLLKRDTLEDVDLGFARPLPRPELCPRGRHGDRRLWPWLVGTQAHRGHHQARQCAVDSLTRVAGLHSRGNGEPNPRRASSLLTSLVAAAA